MSAPSRRILCVEDEPELLEDLVCELADAGYEVLQARTGLEGLAVLLEDRVDLAICDIRMPGLDGIGLLREYRTKLDPEARLPFIMLSAYCDPELQRVAGELGALAFLVKPVDYEELFSLISRLPDS